MAKGIHWRPGLLTAIVITTGDLKKILLALPVTSQGVTTIVIGQDGDSDPVDTLKEQLKNIPVSINIATYTGHASLREMVMKGDVLRAADCTE